jgi:hypothetical protein
MSLADNLAANAADCVKAVHAADNGEPSILRQGAGGEFVGIGVPLRRAISAELAGKTRTCGAEPKSVRGCGFSALGVHAGGR